jgi:hypothetical protein
MRAFTAICLAQAAGLNPALPVLIVATLAACGDMFTSRGLAAPVVLPQELMFAATWWGLAIIIVLTVIEMVGDKIQVVDNIKHTFIDPFASVLSSIFLSVSVMGEPMGQLLKSGKSMTGSLPSCLCIIDGGATFWVGMILFTLVCVSITLFFLAMKALVRYFVSVIPDMGISNIIVSFLEDCLAFINVVLAIFLPVLGMIVTIILGVTAFFAARIMKRRIAAFFKKNKPAEAAI